jgi:hypothetical protein
MDGKGNVAGPVRPDFLPHACMSEISFERQVSSVDSIYSIPGVNASSDVNWRGRQRHNRDFNGIATLKFFASSALAIEVKVLNQPHSQQFPGRKLIPKIPTNWAFQSTFGLFLAANLLQTSCTCAFQL